MVPNEKLGTFFMELNYTKDKIVVRPKDFDEAISFSEFEETFNVYPRDYNFHYWLTGTELKDIREFKWINQAEQWGILFEQLDNVQNVYASKRKRYLRSIEPLEAVKASQRYKRAYDLVEKQFGHVLKDGTEMFEYQKESAALMIATKRTLLALEMGLGKTRTTLVAMTADSSNKRSLIITMSRNINDWINEIKNLGLEDDYILVQNKNDFHSDKRIHLVSYERWARDSVTFKKKSLIKCPSCNQRHFWNMHLGYCSLCKRAQEKVAEERYSEKDLPEECPSCRNDWKGHYECTNCRYSVVESRKKALYQFYSNQYDACAIDEGHKIKNGSSKRSRAVRRVNTKTRYLLSGTPAENGADDLFWPLAWLTGCDSRFDNPLSGNFQPFRGYGKKGEEYFRQYYSGGSRKAILDIDAVESRISNHKMLWKLLDSLMIRKKRLDSDVHSEINVPAPNHHRMHLTLYEGERELYDLLLEQFKEWYQIELARKEAAEARGDKYRISTIEICSWLDKLRKAARSPWQFKEYDTSKGVTTAKLEYTMNKAKSLLRMGKKMLIFSGHKETVEHLGLLMDSVVPGKEAAYIHGDIKMSYRWNLIDRFQDPSDPLSILVLSHRTGSESYTLTEAKSVILFDLDFNPKQMEQCYSRAVRTGQKDVVDFHWLIGVDTIDANMHSLLLSKQSGVDMAIDREELDMEEISKEFKGDMISGGSPTIDYEEFAAEMLGRGTKRHDVLSA